MVEDERDVVDDDERAVDEDEDLVLEDDDEEEALVLDDERVDDVELEQVPKALLHPDPQYAGVRPQYPNCEQQLPDSDPRHVYPLDPPQWPSGDTFGPLEVHVP